MQRQVTAELESNGDTEILEQPEGYFDSGCYVDRGSVLGAGAELPLPHRLDGLFIQAESQRLDDSDIPHSAIPLHDHIQYHGALVLCFPGLLGILGINLEYDRRSTDSSANAEDTAANPAALSGANSASRAGAYAAA